MVVLDLVCMQTRPRLRLLQSIGLFLPHDMCVGFSWA